MEIPIEDHFEDVLMKAATGLGIGKHELAEQAGISLDQVVALLNAERDETALRAVAPVLGLGADRLVAMANREWYPERVEVAGLRVYNTPFPVPGYAEMTVNSYLVWCEATRVAVAFDTGVNAEAMLADVARLGLDLQALMLTHAHRDHVADYDRVLSAIEGGVAFAPELEPVGQADAVQDGDLIEFEGLEIQARLTNGHSPGGMSYVVEGLERPLAVVGDALFCLSQGGARSNYKLALQNNREVILALDEATVLCPGHGPLTTVANERLRNPFFPEFESVAD